ncbi:MAG: FHA domain-containing protein [Proteobacteria bacterium]|nr:FHA domain-containing protein [Pseudomonadota bacterium]
MSRIHKAYIFIEKGNPYDKGTLIPLSKKSISIGRQFSADEPDIAFSNPVISRNHLLIEWKNGSYQAVDKNSKNGTKINDKKLEKSTFYELGNGDRLRLANDTAILLFSYEVKPTTVTMHEESEELQIRFNADRRELFIESQKIVLRGNLYELFGVLYKNRGKVVSHSEIKEAVWPERARDEKGEPFTSEEEIHVLMMRMRHKLGAYSRFLNNIRGYGYILDL